MTNPPNGNSPNGGVPGVTPGMNGMPAQQVQPAQPAQPGQPVQQAQPGEPAASGQPAMPGQAMPAQAMPAQAMPGQTAPAQYSPAQAFPDEDAQAEKPKSKKGIIGVVVAVVALVVVVALLVWTALTGGFTATPTEEEVKQGIEQSYDEYFNIPSEVEEFAIILGVEEEDLQEHYDKSGPQFAQCVTDKIYDRISKDAKIALSEAKRTGFADEDEKLAEDAAGDCYSDLIKEYDSTLPVPSKDDYRKGMEIVYEAELNTQTIVDDYVEDGMSEDKARAFLKQAGGYWAQCMTDDTYGGVSNGTKRYVARGIDAFATDDDREKITFYVGPCLNSALDEFEEKNK